MSQFKYINSFNEEVDFHSSLVFSDEHWLFGYERTATVSKGKLYLTPKAFEKTLDVVVSSDSASTTLAECDRIYRVFDKDASNGYIGALWVGDWYLPCNVINIGKPEASISEGTVKFKVKFYASSPYWMKDVVHYLGVQPDEFVIQNDIMCDATLYFYGSDNHTGVTGLRVYSYKRDGYADDYEITIHDQVVNDGEYIVLDTSSKTLIYKPLEGDPVNILSKRNTSTEIFQKIPSGEVTFYKSNVSCRIELHQRRLQPLFSD